MISAGAYTMSEAEVLAFATAYVLALLKRRCPGRGPFGGLIASGWHTCTIAMWLGTDAAQRGSDSRPGHSGRTDQLRSSIPYFAAMALNSIAGPRRDGLPLPTMDVATSAMKASNIPLGELMINWRPTSGPTLMKL